MPEGHTLHRLAREQNERFAGTRLHVSSPQGRFAEGATIVDDHVLEATRPEHRRRGRVRRIDAHYVYRRAGEPCRVCGTPIARQVIATRNLFWRPTCQPG